MTSAMISSVSEHSINSEGLAQHTQLNLVQHYLLLLTIDYHETLCGTMWVIMTNRLLYNIHIQYNHVMCWIR